MNILLIEDDQSLGKNLKLSLEKEGYKIEWAQSIEEAKRYQPNDFSLILLDWMLPDGQGIDYLKLNPQAPVIMLTARADTLDKVLGLESGACDYITKPFEFRELVARIRVQTRKDDLSSTTTIKLNNLEINLIKREVLYNQEKLYLTKMEFDLLFTLSEYPDQIFSREKLLDKVWGYENYPTTRTVDTHVLQLRQKISSELIETIRGIGYRLGESFVKKN